MRLSSIVSHFVLSLGRKKLNVPSLVTETIVLSSDQIRYFTLSANSIKILYTSDGIKYFRTCRMHKNFDDYLNDGIREFYALALQGASTDNFAQKTLIKTKFTQDYIEKFALYVNDLLRKDSFWNKIERISIYLDKWRFTIWNDAYDLNDAQLEAIGLASYPSYLQEIKPLFVSYLRGLVGAYFSNEYVGVGNYECYGAIRSICSFIIAKALGVEHLITETHFTRLIVDGKEEYGVLCERANGSRAQDCNGIEISPSLQKELLSLHLLDAICYQKDHGVNNYNIYRTEDGNQRICAFDNDNSMTFCVMPLLLHFCPMGVSPLIKDGKINRPHIDRVLGENVMKLDVDSLGLNVYLNRLQLFALRCRIKLIANAIKTTIKQNPKFLLDAHEWTDETIQKELNGNSGKTYLYLLRN